MLDTVLHAILDFVGAHSALLTVLILIALGVGMVLCLTVQKRRFTVREIAVMGMLAELGAIGIDADKVAHQVVIPGEPAYAQVLAEFGPGGTNAFAGVIVGEAVEAVERDVGGLHEITEPQSQ